LAVLLALASSSPAAARPEPAARGLWLLPRKDAANTARADLPGNMKAAPKEVWRFGGDHGGCEYATAVTVRGQEACLVQSRTGLRLQRPDSGTIWSNPRLGIGSVVQVSDYDGDGAAEALVTLGTRGFALVELTSSEGTSRPGEVLFSSCALVGFVSAEYVTFVVGRALVLIGGVGLGGAGGAVRS